MRNFILGFMAFPFVITAAKEIEKVIRGYSRYRKLMTIEEGDFLEQAYFREEGESLDLLGDFE